VASYYVRSAAAGSNNGTNWANAYTTLAAAFSGKSAGDVFYVAADHSETTAGTVALNAPAAPNSFRAICVDHTGTVPPVPADLRTTAQVKASGNNTIQLNGSGDYFGIIFIAGDSTGTAIIYVNLNGNNFTRFTNCSLRIGSTGAGYIKMGNDTQLTQTELINTTVSFTNVAQNIRPMGRFVWHDTPSALLGTIPTALISVPGAYSLTVEFIGVDFSAMGSGKTLFNIDNAYNPVSGQVSDCKVDAAATKFDTFLGPAAAEVDFVRCGSTGVNYTLTRFRWSGTLTEETTIVRTGGASDGTTPIAWKIVTTTRPSWALPFETPPIAIWNDTVGSSKTATIQGIMDGGTLPNNDEIWVEVTYLGSSSSPQASIVHDSKATVLTAAAAQDAGTGTWGGSTTKFALAVAFTAQQKGWIYARVKVGKISTTYYIDPLITLT